MNGTKRSSVEWRVFSVGRAGDGWDPSAITQLGSIWPSVEAQATDHRVNISEQLATNCAVVGRVTAFLANFVEAQRSRAEPLYQLERGPPADLKSKLQGPSCRRPSSANDDRSGRTLLMTGQQPLMMLPRASRALKHRCKPRRRRSTVGINLDYTGTCSPIDG
jgi:hypothetical protein